ncbi:hypothetical protein [Xanthobacter sp. 126]|uniref:hypothetical protein n=1 Tax=Xanthobacter sp. 126 TaxID=1131814 RepID=UPI00045EC605|nr:hypothetical protein [Xanthobacter sp. 126]
MPTAQKPVDPVIALIAQWRDARAELASRPPTNAESWHDAYGWRVDDDLNQAPSAQSLEGAIAALELAQIESDFAPALVRSALGFLKTFTAPVERPATRSEMEAYREWLFMEGRLLGMELYPEMGDDADRVIPCNTGVGELHLPPCGSWRKIAKPSSRAVRILTAVGANLEKIARCGEKGHGILWGAEATESEDEARHG